MVLAATVRLTSSQCTHRQGHVPVYKGQIGMLPLSKRIDYVRTTLFSHLFLWAQSDKFHYCSTMSVRPKEEIERKVRTQEVNSLRLRSDEQHLQPVQDQTHKGGMSTK